MSPLHVVLVAPEIPWNTGNAVGARLHLVRPLGFSLDERRVRRAGLDYWSAVEPRVWPSLSAFEEHLPKLGEPLLMTAEADQDLFDIELPEHPVLIFGGEGAGLPIDFRRRHRNARVALPMAAGPVRSLNLSTAVAVAAYEVRRRQGWRGPGTSLAE